MDGRRTGMPPAAGEPAFDAAAQAAAGVSPDEPATPGAPAVPAKEGTAGEGTDPGEVLTKRQVQRRNARDIGMLVLGVASLAIVGYDFLYRATLPREQIALLEWVDLGIVGVFAAEFAWRWRQDRWRLGFAARNWFDLLGMVPMMATNIPLFRAFRLLRIGMVASRLLRMWAFVTGQRSAQFVFDRYRAALVEQVTDRVMLSTLAMVEDVAARGGYTKALGDSLARQRGDIVAAVLKGAHEGGTGQVLAAVPGAEAAVRAAVESTVDSLVVALRSEEMQRTFAASVKAILDQTRAEVQREAWRERTALPAPGPVAAPPPPRLRGA